MSKPRPSTSSAISVNVPSKAVGKAIETVIEWFRPFTERQGLKADHLRLQREDVLIEIARRARQRLAIEIGAVAPIPAKVLVPLIEAASIEDPNDEYMINMWAALLASATKDDRVEPRFISILRELTAKHAQLLHSIATNNWDGVNDPKRELHDAPHELDAWVLRSEIGHIVDRAPKIEAKDWGKAEKAYLAFVLQEIEDCLVRPGCAVVDILQTRNKKISNLAASNQSGHIASNVDFEVLISLGLCRKVSEDVSPIIGHEVTVIYYHLTHLGLKFLMCCNPETFE